MRCATERSHSGSGIDRPMGGRVQGPTHVLIKNDPACTQGGEGGIWTQADLPLDQQFGIRSIEADNGTRINTQFGTFFEYKAALVVHDQLGTGMQLEDTARTKVHVGRMVIQRIAQSKQSARKYAHLGRGTVLRRLANELAFGGVLEGCPHKADRPGAVDG